MEKGFLIDKDHSGVQQGRWVEGEPQSAWWRTGVKVSDKECRAVVVWRCTNCGFLESYATEKTEPPSWLRF
jgi:hypothetical protein